MSDLTYTPFDRKSGGAEKSKTVKGSDVASVTPRDNRNPATGTFSPGSTITMKDGTSVCAVETPEALKEKHKNLEPLFVQKPKDANAPASTARNAAATASGSSAASAAPAGS